MAEYQISARLTLTDQLTAKLQAARREAEKLTRGIGNNRDITFNVKMQGAERIKQMRELLRQAGHNLPPINLRVTDNATSKIQQLTNKVKSLASKPYNVMVNIKTNGMAALNRAKSTIGEMVGGAALGMGAGILGTAGIGYGVVNAIQSQMDFEKQMSAVQAILGYDKPNMAALTAAAEEIGATTKFTAAQAAQAQYYQGDQPSTLCI